MRRAKQPVRAKARRSSSPSARPAARFDADKVRARVQRALSARKAAVLEQRAPVARVLKRTRERPREPGRGYFRTGVPGLDELLEHGVPRQSAVLVAGGAGSGKTILCLEILAKAAARGERCLYMSFEESEERLRQHMEDFGWDTSGGRLVLKRFNPFDITRSVEALLEKSKGELLIDVEPIILPQGFRPDVIVLDSLTAVASAFTGREDSYRIYIEQLFRFFEKIGATSFLITETKQIPTVFSSTGVEEFLADGVIVLYSIKRGNIRENALEVLKMRGEQHQKRIVAMQIVGGKGVVVYPEQEIFGSVEAER